MKPALEEQEAQRLVETYSDLILRLSYTYLNHTQDAQDICQTVFLKLWEKAPTFVSPDHERAWIIRTTANTCKDLLKSHWRKTTAPLEAAAAVPAPQPEEPCRKSTGTWFTSTTTRGTPPRRSQLSWARPPPRWPPSCTGGGCG